MAQFSLSNVTVFARVPGSTSIQLVAEHHYVRLRGGEAEAPLYIQHGQVFSEGGDSYALEEVPAWFWVELAKVSPQALLACGWQGPVTPPAPSNGDGPEDDGDDEMPPRDPSGRFQPRR